MSPPTGSEVDQPHEPVDPPQHRRSRLSQGRSQGLAWCLAASGFALSALVVSHDELTADWFADEAWRANFVRSPRWWDLYTSWDTPTPPGFVLLFRALGLVLPNGPLALRIGTLVSLVCTLVLVLCLLFAIIDRPPSGPREPDADRGSDDQGGAGRTSMRIAAVAACLAVPLLSAFGVHRTFVPYFIETAFAAALLLGCVHLDRHRRAWPALLTVVVLTPLFGIGSMFLLPATAAYLLIWSWRQADRRRHVSWSVGVLAAASVEALAVYWFAYRPVARDTIARYWAGSSLRGDPGRFGELMQDTLRLVRDGLLAWSRPSLADRLGPAVWVVLSACAIVGLVSLGRRWPPLLGFIASGWVCIVLASVVTGWPMTVQRVNLPVFVFVYVAVLYGGVRLVSRATRELVPVAVVAGVVLVGLLWPTDKTVLFGDAFLRGLTPDLAVIADSPARQNLVLTYHVASRWYAEDALVTRASDGRTYVVVPETYTDLSVYDPVSVAAAFADMPAGAAIWCVIPFDVGPEAAERACPVPPDLAPIFDERGTRSLIKGFLKP